ncbi:MAG: hypothetical protein ACLRRJ_03265 [Clostridium sp.]
MSDEQVNSIIKLSAGAAAIGPLIIGFGKVVTGASSFLGVIAKVSKAGGVFKFAFAAISGPVGIVIGAILALIAVMIMVEGIRMYLNVQLMVWAPIPKRKRAYPKYHCQI